MSHLRQHTNRVLFSMRMLYIIHLLTYHVGYNASHLHKDTFSTVLFVSMYAFMYVPDGFSSSVSSRRPPAP